MWIVLLLSLEALLQQAALYQSRGDEAGLLSVALQGVEQFPAEKRFYLTAGTYAGRRRDFDTAIKVLDRGVARWKDDAKLRSLLASAYFGRGTASLDKGDAVRAVEDLQRGAELTPNDAEILLNLGRALHNAARYSEAVAVFERVPDSALVRFHRATSRLALGQTDSAIADLRGEIEPSAQLVRGLAYLTQGDVEPALKDLENAATAMPESAPAQYGYARALLRVERLKEAEMRLRSAIRLDSSDTGPANTLSALLHRIGKGEAPASRPKAVSVKAPQFIDVSEKAGIAMKSISGDAAEKKYLVESVGGGLAAIDYNNDGFMDLYVVNGNTIPRARKGLPSYPSALYRNNRDGTFTDVAASAGVTNRHWGKGAIAADFDGDGWVDLYVVNFGPNTMYRNLGNGKFRDVTKQAGVGDPRWSAAAAAADYDKDGDLDLFVANYLDYDLEKLPSKGKFCSYQNIPVACGPRGLKGSGDTLYRNNGDGTFTDVSVAAGVSDPGGYYGLAVAWGDYDNDGDPDLYVANDNSPNQLYRNNGDGTFTDVAVETGAAFSEDGREQSCMGVEFEDLDNDGWLDIMVTNFSDDYNTLYRNSGKGFFRDDSHRAGLVTDSWSDLSWGVGFYDFDNDGWKDVFIANGHIYPQVDRHRLNTTYRQKNKMYMNTGSPKLAPVSGLDTRKSYRGAAFADIDNDGDIDIAVGALDDSPSLLMNREGAGKNWLMFRLEGAGKNRFGIGARVYVTSGGIVQMREVKAGGSYASSSDPRVHFGLGVYRTAEVEVRWVSGKTTKLSHVQAGKIVTIRE